MFRQCANPRCRGNFAIEFFEGKGGDASSPKSRRRSRCRGCLDTQRDIRKRENRWLKKAHDTIKRHGQRLKISKKELIEKFGWEPAKVAHRMEHAYGNGCCYCDDLFVNMGHGLGDVTIDVIDPRKDPYWRINTNVACMSCNRRKGILVPEVWAIVLREYKKWKAHHDALGKDPWIGTLYAGMNYVGSIKSDMADMYA